MKAKKAEAGTSHLPIADMAPLMEECIAQGQEVILTVTGNSMRPFLRHQLDQVVLIQANKAGLQPGDVPLYRRANGRYVLHRVVERIEGGVCCSLRGRTTPTANAAGVRYTLLGDAQTEPEYNVMPEQIVAVAKAFYCRGKLVSCDAPAYRRRVLRWHRLLPIRAPLVFICRLPERVLRRIRKSM